MPLTKGPREIEFIDKLHAAGCIGSIDRHFARMIFRFENNNPASGLLVAAALTSRYITCDRHVCLDFSVNPERIADGVCSEGIAEICDNEKIRQNITGYLKDFSASICKNSPAVALYPGDGSNLYKPLLIENERLYLQKYWHAEEELVRQLQHRCKKEEWFRPEIIADVANIYDKFSASSGPHWQIIAVCAALRNRFSVIAGGPGTGKTSVVAAFLALMLKNFPEIRIALCAPTGKAQARLNEALRDECAHLSCEDAVREKILSLKASTIHMLLGNLPDGSSRYNKQNPLPVDLLVVDEVSMTELLLLNRLLQTIPEESKVLFLGDPGQLASVEAGAAFSDICASAKPEIFSAEFASLMHDNCNLEITTSPDASAFDDCVVELTHAFRFSEEGGIGRLKNLVKSGNADEAVKEISNLSQLSPERGRVICDDLPDDYKELRTRLFGFLEKWQNHEFSTSGEINKTWKFSDYIHAETVADAFGILSRFRILSPFRQGNCGTISLNNIVSEFFGFGSKLIHGTPVMIIENDYNLQLFNGDMGIIWQQPGKGLRVYFPAAENQPNAEISGFRSFPVNRLPAHEVSFAITVHKSQGSGFDCVLLLLPENRPSSREMLYTAITRARYEVTLWCDKSSFAGAVQNPTMRHSGLRQKLSKF